MSAELEQYLDYVKFEKQLKKLNKKLKNKKVLIYGAGLLFKTAQEKYDLSKLNIIGISDMRITDVDAGKDMFGYPAIPFDKIIDAKPDYVLIATQRFLGILENFEKNVFVGTKIKVLPFIDKPFFDLVKEIWGL